MFEQNRGKGLEALRIRNERSGRKSVAKYLKNAALLLCFTRFGVQHCNYSQKRKRQRRLSIALHLSDILLCQIAFHEKCYVPETLTDKGSGGSNTSNAQFFCEPCLYGLKEPPYCELCPNRYGAFKRADIGGGWVHLLCALYTPGVTFSDLNRLTGVSWQEVDYKSFGKRTCVACSDPLQTRTGIAVQCDAGLCKNHFHVTCAQRFDECDVEAEERRYLNCKRHADKEAMCLGSVRCALMCAQEESRMLGLRRRTLSENAEQMRIRLLEQQKKALKELEGINISWPEVSPCALMCAQEESRMLGLRRRTLSENAEQMRIRLLEQQKKALKELEGINISWPEVSP
ncbi:unnamed protein product [Gongylonema pulchrum]|uniref:PHD-type domain-containing protein n=1 Tax=Gongylonema pulchrum TaxID=637853 RepID=A0A183DU22_9BILA|nr:unnamed protein product [Gongylonema pulchrum]